MSCCNTGIALKREYDNALRFEAICYAKLIAHKRRHEEVEERPVVSHMRVVNQIAEQYAKGNVEPLAEIPPTSRELEI